MRLWETDFTTQTGLRGLFAPMCKHCDVMGDFYMAKGHKFALHDGFAYHVDIEMRCPKCGYWWPYGVAISKEHYEWFDKEFENAIGK